jgi:predicted CXXCH cytochrome family protein
MSPRRAAGFALLPSLELLIGCGADGAPQYPGGPPTVEATYGQCAFCHSGLGARMVLYGGHGSLSVNCESCHSEDLTPGFVGPDHRSVPACADCHGEEMTHEDPAAGTPQACLQCHTPHGSPNLFLVNEQITDPDAVVHDVDFTNLGGRDDGGFASASDPGTGLCEVCHTTTAYYRNDGTGSAHFTNTCVVCHTHAAGFAP